MICVWDVVVGKAKGMAKLYDAISRSKRKHTRPCELCDNIVLTPQN